MRKVVVVCLAALALLPGSAEAFEEPPPYFGHPLPAAHAFALTTGPDGNVWFAGPRSSGTLVIDKVTPSGEVTEYQRPSSANAYSITTGPDGNLWFVEWGRGAIGRITPDGDATSFRLPDPKSHPTAIVMGPDGNLWFTEHAADRVGRITTSGRITEFPTSSGAQAIVSGPEGSSGSPPAVWSARSAPAARFHGLPGAVLPGIPRGAGSRAGRQPLGRHRLPDLQGPLRRRDGDRNGQLRPATTPTSFGPMPARQERSKRNRGRSSSPSPGDLARPVRKRRDSRWVSQAGRRPLSR